MVIFVSLAIILKNVLQHNSTPTDTNTWLTLKTGVKKVFALYQFSPRPEQKILSLPYRR